MSDEEEHSGPIVTRLHASSKREVAAAMCTALCVFFVMLAVTLSGPNVQSSTTHSSHTLGVNVAAGQNFTVSTQPMTEYNRHLWLAVTVQLQRIPATAAVPVQLSPLVRVWLERQPVGSAEWVHVHWKGTPRLRTVVCDAGETDCAAFIAVHVGHVVAGKYRATVNMADIDTQVSPPIGDVLFTWTAVDDAYSRLETWYRFVFLAFAFIALLLFAFSLRHYRLSDWNLEQRWLLPLLLLLLLYNGPFVALELLVSSVVPVVLDALFQCAFLATLLLFWLTFFRSLSAPSTLSSVRSNNRLGSASRIGSSGVGVGGGASGTSSAGHCRNCWSPLVLSKTLLCALLFILALALSLIQAIAAHHDPTYFTHADLTGYTAARVLFFILLSCYLVYVLTLMLMAAANAHALHYPDRSRLLFVTTLSCVVGVSALTGLFVRFGSRLVLSNVHLSSSTRFNNSTELLVFYNLFSMYLFTMAFLFSPARPGAYPVTVDDEDRPSRPDSLELNALLRPDDEDEDEDDQYGPDEVLFDDSR